MEPGHPGLRPSGMRATFVSVCLTTLLVSGCAASSASTDSVAPSRSRTAATAPNASAGCPTPMNLKAGQGIAIDYADTLRIEGRDYLISNDKPPVTWDPAHTGAPARTITCTLSTQTIDPNYQLRDGDATFLPVGTAVYLVQTPGGVTEAVAKVGGSWRVYLPQSRA